MAKSLVNSQGQVIADEWIVLEDDATAPTGKSIIVSLDRLQSEKPKLITHAKALGVQLPNTVDVAELNDVLTDCALVVLQFPIFGDGRAYSQARLLRERLGFQGEVRAVGDVHYDQLFYMARCGFDSFEVSEDTAAKASRAFDAFTVAYQATASGPAVQKAG